MGTSERPRIDPATRAAQSAATNPASSAWVSANAGSGKTFVLSRRVIRLLLAGIDPSRVLCLTFTKAAAAEMAKRVFTELARWTTLSDVALAAEIVAIEGRAPVAALVAAARKLFAKALDTPGGLKIQTIHAFCERLLHQFPFEANVAGHFEVLDERNAKALKDEARRGVLTRAAGSPEGGLGQALRAVLARVSDRTHEDSLEEFIDDRDAIGAWIVQCEDLEGAIEDLREKLGVRSGETSYGLRSEVVDGAPFDVAATRRLMDSLRASSPADVAAAARLAPFAELADADTRTDAWLDFFFTDQGLRKSFVTKAIKDDWPGLGDLLDKEGGRLLALLDRLRTAELFETSAAMLRLADGAIAEYDRLKRQRGVLDFEDLIVRTATLLARSDASRWVHYKLDQGLDHILVDEAQDTSPRQWQVIGRLADEFFAGDGAGPSVRTLFAVGDEKQSIFSFQGAVPAWFSRMQGDLGKAARAATYAWADLELHLSFRSVPKILGAVDAVFQPQDVHRGLTAEPRPTLHTARRRNEPGRVVVWPRLEALEKPSADDWIKPLDHLGEDSPEVKLAKRIATTIKGWRDRKETLDALDEHGRPRPIRPGGILILVRSRGALTDAINRHLKTNGVPIAGADRINIAEHIAVMDLMALGRVALLPEDDLSLAALLKSPLVGLDEDALFALAYGRVGSLWSALCGKAGEREDFARAKGLIDGWRARADTVNPHAFFARILGPDGGRRAFLRRLGPEAEDVLDEFISQTLAYEQTNAPSLEGFLAWLIAAEMEVRRDTDTLRDEVRVMTVHGAKGLEADIVFLVDNGTLPAIPGHDTKVLPLADDPDPLSPGPVVWMRTIKAMPTAVRERVERERERDREEYRRLLYVGMTRAKDQLYVVGLAKQSLKDDNRWHPLVTQGLKDGLVERQAADGEVEFEWRPAAFVAGRETVAVTEATIVAELPEWAKRAAPAAPPVPVRITPSSAMAGEPTVPAPFFARNDPATKLALERGRLIHRMLESLPDIAPDRRAEIGARYLAAFAKSWSDEDRGKLLEEVLAVLDHAGFAEAFGENSRAEVEIAGRLGVATVTGRIDRLAVTPDRVLIVDYKTNRPAPEKLDDVPPAYITQLAIYRTLIERLYPDHRIAVGLLWTDRPSLMEIPLEALKPALP